MKDEETLKKIGEKLRKLRIQAGHKAYDKFAYTFGLDTQTVLRAETGKNITLSTLIKILNVHKMSLKEFFKDFD
jgi:transcriptional regulator with XRE-family HTH domain